MNKFFYAKLALRNIRQNGRTYYPYILTSVLTIMMFYIMNALALSNTIKENVVYGENMQMILMLGCIVIGIFSVIFLFYANSFLIKRRKKEIGLLNILGMEKRHIARMMLWESLFTAGFSIIGGLVSGVVFSKLAFMFLSKLVKYDSLSDFPPNVTSMIGTAIFFMSIFFLTLLFNILQTRLAKPVELLRSGNVGEKEPKAKWFLALLGAVSLAIGYIMALSVESSVAAIGEFFIAVIFVIIGTYFLFTAGSILFLKIMKKNKKYYYQKNHFIAVSGMLYRMKKNAAGLANIAILSTMVLVTVSTTISLYAGQQAYVDTAVSTYARAVCYSHNDEEFAETQANLDKLLEKYNLTKTNEQYYRYISYLDMDSATRTQYMCIPLDDYNRIEGTNAVLDDNEAIVFGLYTKYEQSTVNIKGTDLQVTESLDSMFGTDCLNVEMDDQLYVIMKDINAVMKLLDKDTYNYDYGFDLQGSEEDITAFDDDLESNKLENGYLETKASIEKSMYAIYGGLLFIGIFLGALFLMITVLIIYYKQITEGYEDKSRYEILEKVGMSQQEIKKSVKSQVMGVFFLPLIVAVIHIAFAFRMITKMLAVLGLLQTWLFALCVLGTIIVFSVIYIIVYMLTAKAYYKIVK